MLPSCAFRTEGASFAITCPWSITATRSARRSASSRYCVVNRTVVPSSTSSLIMSQSPLRLCRSSPVVGSSRNSTGGRGTSAAATSRRRRIPPEYVRTGRSAASERSNRSRSSAALGGMADVSIWVSRPIKRRFSRPVRFGSTAANWPASPIRRRTASGSSATSCPSTAARPPSGSSTVARIRIAVVFPAPLGPRSPNTERVGTAKSIPSRAITSPNRFVSPSTSIAALVTPTPSHDG